MLKSNNCNWKVFVSSFLFCILVLTLQIYSQYSSENVNLLGRWANGRCYGIAMEGDVAHFGIDGYTSETEIVGGYAYVADS